MKDRSMAVGMSLGFARRRRPARRAIPTARNAGGVGISGGWYQARELETPGPKVAKVFWFFFSKKNALAYAASGFSRSAKDLRNFSTFGATTARQ